MNFDPKPSILSSQDDAFDYLMKHRSCLLSLIKVEFYPATTDVKEPPLAGGMYFHLLNLGIRSIVGLNATCWDIIK